MILKFNGGEKQSSQRTSEELEHQAHNTQAKTTRKLFTLQLHRPDGNVAHDATAEYEVEEIVGRDRAADLHFWYVTSLIIEQFNQRLGRHLFSDNTALKTEARKLILELAASRYDAEQKNKIDPLTGLSNRIKFNEEKSKLLSEKRDFDYCIVMIDLDDFKKVNDTHGHLVGDELLREFAQRFERVTRAHIPSGIVFRYGGEEFSCFFPFQKGKHPKEVHTVLEKIFIDILKEPFTLRKDGGFITYVLNLSAGAAFLPAETHIPNPDTIIHYADKELLYLAKGTKLRRQEKNMNEGQRITHDLVFSTYAPNE